MEEGKRDAEAVLPSGEFATLADVVRIVHRGCNQSMTLWETGGTGGILHGVMMPTASTRGQFSTVTSVPIAARSAQSSRRRSCLSLRKTDGLQERNLGLLTVRPVCGSWSPRRGDVIRIPSRSGP